MKIGSRDWERIKSETFCLISNDDLFLLYFETFVYELHGRVFGTCKTLRDFAYVAPYAAADYGLCFASSIYSNFS